MKKILIGVVALAVLGAIVGVSLKQRGGGRGVKVYMEEAANQSRLLATVSASGEIRPRVEVSISSQVPGQIVQLTVNEGDHAKAGHVLVQLDPQRYRSEVQRLEALLRMDGVNVEREDVALKTAEVTLRRQEALHTQKIVSDESLDQARLNVDSGTIGLRSLAEQVRQAEADLGRARDDLSKTTLKAPISGLVSRLNAKVGEQVIIGTMNNPGTVILTLSDMTEVLAEVRVDETEVTQVKPGQAAKINVDAVEGTLSGQGPADVAGFSSQAGDVGARGDRGGGEEGRPRDPASGDGPALAEGLPRGRDRLPADGRIDRGGAAAQGGGGGQGVRGKGSRARAGSGRVRGEERAGEDGQGEDGHQRRLPRGDRGRDRRRRSRRARPLPRPPLAQERRLRPSGREVGDP